MQIMPDSAFEVFVELWTVGFWESYFVLIGDIFEVWLCLYRISACVVAFAEFIDQYSAFTFSVNFFPSLFSAYISMLEDVDIAWLGPSLEFWHI